MFVDFSSPGRKNPTGEGGGFGGAGSIGDSSSIAGIVTINQG